MARVVIEGRESQTASRNSSGGDRETYLTWAEGESNQVTGERRRVRARETDRETERVRDRERQSERERQRDRGRQRETERQR